MAGNSCSDPETTVVSVKHWQIYPAVSRWTCLITQCTSLRMRVQLLLASDRNVKTFTTNQRQSSGRAPSSSSSSTACPVTGLWDSAGAGESGCHSLCLRRVDSFTADIKLICCEVLARGCAANEAGQWQLEIRRRLQLNWRSYRATVAVPSSPHTHTHTHTAVVWNLMPLCPACSLGVPCGTRQTWISREDFDTIRCLPN